MRKLKLKSAYYEETDDLISDASESTSMTWDVYGKLRSVTGGAADVAYTYDAQGNRLAKIGTGTEPTDIYIRDASGNVLALYSRVEGAMDTVRETLKELYLYGSSRLAIVRPDRTIYSTIPGETEAGVSLSSYRREKYFEASNHPLAAEASRSPQTSQQCIRPTEPLNIKT